MLIWTFIDLMGYQIAILENESCLGIEFGLKSSTLRYSYNIYLYANEKYSWFKFKTG